MTQRPRTAEKLRAYYADPLNMALHLSRMARPATREKISKRTKAALADPNVKQRQVEGLNRYWSDPARRAAAADAAKAAQARWAAERIAAAEKAIAQLPASQRAAALERLGRNS